MEEVILEVGIRKERRQERGQHPQEDGGTSWGGGQGTPSHPRVSPGQRGWWRCLTSHNLGDLWSKGGNKQAYSSFPVTHFFPPGVELEIQGILCAEGKLTIPEPQVVIKQHWQ